MIKVMDYGVGNLGSVMNMLDYLDIPAERVTDPDAIRGATAAILPGVGAFDAAAGKFHASGFREPLLERIKAGEMRLLGICVGMQLLCDGSDEGQAEGLGLISGRCVRFSNRTISGDRLRVPHMGWSELDITAHHALVDGLGADARFYFVHSYHMECKVENVIASAEYGDRFNAIVSGDNVVGCQFHPEKSHRFGMSIFRNFHKWVTT